MSEALAAELRLDDDIRFPPSADIIVVRNQHRQLALPIAGIPSGSTLSRVIFTVKTTWRDADAAITLQKIVTTATVLATVGQITDTGASGIGRITISLVPADLVALAASSAFQLWAEVLTAAMVTRRGPALIGAVRVRPPVPNILP